MNPPFLVRLTLHGGVISVDGQESVESSHSSIVHDEITAADIGKQLAIKLKSLGANKILDKIIH